MYVQCNAISALASGNPVQKSVLVKVEMPEMPRHAFAGALHRNIKPICPFHLAFLALEQRHHPSH
jgi:hypothetical protein